MPKETPMTAVEAKESEFFYALDHNNYNVSAACQDLEIARSTAYRWLKRRFGDDWQLELDNLVREKENSGRELLDSDDDSEDSLEEQ